MSAIAQHLIYLRPKDLPTKWRIELASASLAGATLIAVWNVFAGGLRCSSRK